MPTILLLKLLPYLPAIAQLAREGNFLVKLIAKAFRGEEISDADLDAAFNNSTAASAGLQETLAKAKAKETAANLAP